MWAAAIKRRAEATKKMRATEAKKAKRLDKKSVARSGMPPAPISQSWRERLKFL